MRHGDGEQDVSLISVFVAPFSLEIHTQKGEGEEGAGSSAI